MPPLVTVLIDNYNYADFLPAAIDSAIGQTHSQVEVLVVDDGSADASREILASYGGRIRVVYQRNAGQATALNAGVREARGEIVITLDSDDVLHPDLAARVVAEFAADPRCVKVAYRLEVISAAGERTGRRMPPTRVPLQQGDLRAQALRVRGFRTAPTSGNAWSTAALRRLPPVPVDTYRQHADRWWSDLVALLGTVRLLPEPGGLYRVHASNHSRVEVRELTYFTDRIERRQVLHQAAGVVAAAEGLTGLPASPDGMRDAALCSWRLAAGKLGAQPGPDATRWSYPRLVLRGIAANAAQPDKSFRTRCAHTGWFAALACLPKGPRAQALVQKRFGTDD
jgi:hypothetical protein